MRDTSGIQVRLSTSRSESRRARHARGGEGRGRRRGPLVGAGLAVLVALVAVGLALTLVSRRDGGGRAASGASGSSPSVRPPAGGPAIEVGTADGSRYRLAAVTGGLGDGGGTSFAYIEYVLTNPADRQVLLDFPGDVFVKRDLVAADARERCMPQPGVPEDMCTPPTRSEVVRRLGGAALVPGDGGDRYLPPGASYLVRAVVDVPVERRLTRADLGLYVWKQLYMADRLATAAPFPG